MQGSYPDWQPRAARPRSRADRPGPAYRSRVTPAQGRANAEGGSGAARTTYRSGSTRTTYGGRAGASSSARARAAARASTAPAKQRGRRRTPVWAIVTVTFGALLLLGSGTAIAGYEFVNNRYADNVQQDNLLGEAAAPPGQELDGPLNMLLLGVEEQGEGVRSDTVIVLHIPASHDQAYLLSVPRDTLVTVPGYYDMKITEAFNLGYEENGGGWAGGAQIIASTVNNLTGLQFNGAAIVNFAGFQRIIDELGGIEFCVDTPATSEHLILVDGEPVNILRAQREGLYGEPIRYEEGCQTLQGWQALDYARQRKNLEDESGDYGRQRHQVQLLRAMADQMTSTDVLTNLGTLDSMVLAAGDALIVDTNEVPLADFVYTLRDLRPGNLVTLRTNGGEFNSTQINGISYEILNEQSLAMFRAAAEDTMAQFVIANPEFVNQQP